MKLGFLGPLFDRPGPWASVYAGTSLRTEDAAARQEPAARGACERLARLGADDRTCRVVYDALTALPRTTQPPGRAVFAAGGEVVLGPALSTPPEDTRAFWTALPHIGPLLDLTDGEPTCLIASIDRTGADFELRGPLGTHAAGGVQGEEWPVHRTATAEPPERHFQQAVEDTRNRTAAAVAERLAARQAETGAELVVLAGDPRERRAVRERLPAAVRETARETAHGGRAAGAASRLLEEDIERARGETFRRREEEMLRRFRAGRIPDEEGRRTAAEGLQALVDAAREHGIAELLLRPHAPDLEREVWVGHDPDQLAVRRAEVQYLGDPRPVTARADDALLRSAAVTGAGVLPVHPAPGGGPVLPAGGLGALLRRPYRGG